VESNAFVGIVPGVSELYKLMTEEWTLKDSIFQSLNSTTYGNFNIDSNDKTSLLSNSWNLPLETDWTGYNILCVPPFDQVLKYLSHYLKQNS
jgi:hypothetical protein